MGNWWFSGRANRQSTYWQPVLRRLRYPAGFLLVTPNRKIAIWVFNNSSLAKRRSFSVPLRRVGSVSPSLLLRSAFSWTGLGPPRRIARLRIGFTVWDRRTPCSSLYLSHMTPSTDNETIGSN